MERVALFFIPPPPQPVIKYFVPRIYIVAELGKIRGVNVNKRIVMKLIYSLL